jgi:hypothetical protein
MHQTTATDSVFSHAHTDEPHSAAHNRAAAAVLASMEAMPAHAMTVAPLAVASVALLAVAAARDSSSSSSSSSSEPLSIRCIKHSSEYQQQQEGPSCCSDEDESMHALPATPAEHYSEHCRGTYSSSIRSSDSSSEYSAGHIQCATGGELPTAAESASESRSNITDAASSASSSNSISRELVVHQQAHVRSSRSSSNSSGDDSEPVHRNSYTSGETPPLWRDSYRSLMFGSESDISSGSDGSGSKHHAIVKSHNSDSSDSEHSSSTSQSYNCLHTVQCEQQAVQLSQQQQQQQQHQVSAQDGSSSGACVAADSTLQSGESPLTHNGASLHSDLFSSESAEAALFTSEHRSSCSSAVSYSDSSSSSSVLDEENDRCASGSEAEAAAAYAHAGAEEHKACDSDDDGEALAQEPTSNSSAYKGNSRGIKSRGSIDSHLLNATFDSSAAEELSSSSAHQAQDCYDTHEV